MILKWLCFSAALLTWPLIPYGAFVRLKNAGLSCPDWPLCYGQLLPPAGYEIALETGHRFVAALLVLLIITITFVSFRQHSNYHIRGLALFSLVLVCIQGIIGALTVTMTLWPPIVTLHLIGGNLLFGVLVYLARITFSLGSRENSEINDSGFHRFQEKSGMRSRVGLMIAVLFIIIASGGYNSSTYSGLHCEAFPGCHEGSYLSFGMSGTDLSKLTGIEGHILQPAPEDYRGRFLPEFRNEWIHMLHRFIAVFGGLALIIMSWVWLKNRFGYNVLNNFIVLLILLEIIVGVLNSVLRVPVPISALHTTVAAALTGLMFYVFAENYQIKEKA
ncbi:uncharacterized protein METZ01_LOCUS170049 [marine metagenome]|uniref:Cytochrome oxidase assembly protein n=1 Tax=marine metagenome TaxID=408172 RepID=A0A382BTR4_9ZZZZ